MKRPVSIILAALAVALVLTAGGFAYDPKEDLSCEFDELTDDCLDSINKGLEFLASRQQDDGSWIDMIGRKESEKYIGHVDKFVGATAIALMAFMSNGQLPGRGRYGDVVEKGIDWLLEQIDEKGYISYSESRMYSHAFATLCLAEAYGMTRNPKLEDKLRTAIRCICASQTAQGGWRYLPVARDNDMSITVCQIMALRSAREAGIYVDKKVIAKAIDYVKKSWSPGGFLYQVYEVNTRTSFALTAAGVVALQGAGEYNARETRKGIQWMSTNMYTYPQVNPARMHDTFDYFYANYYAVQAMFQAGGKEWKSWYTKVRKDLIRGQKRYSNGRWQDLVGANYATAMATMILQIPMRYLPIFTR